MTEVVAQFNKQGEYNMVEESIVGHIIMLVFIVGICFLADYVVRRF